MPVPEITISISQQTLSLCTLSGSRNYGVSTALNGSGQVSGSGCTPLGKHLIRAKIGADKPLGSVFVGRRWTGEIYSSLLAHQYPDRDWILSRILWLSGLEPGHNRLGQVDTMRRYIYIHGTPEEDKIGQPVSHGCIRMTNRDVIELFELCPVGTLVTIIK